MHMANYNAKTLSISKNGDNYTYDTCAIHYGICSTAAATQTKVVSIPEIEELAAGLSIRIQFANEQAYNGTPILQLNSFEGKDIIRNGNNDSEQYEWQAGEVLDFFYDGTAWVIVEGSAPSTTHYGSRVKLSSATNSSSEDLAATPLAVKNAYDLANGKVSCTTENVKNALGTGAGTTRFLREDGTWVVPSGSMPIVVQLDAVSDQGGNHYYSHTTTNLEGVVADMKAIQLECSNPNAFQDKITVQVDDGEVTLSCNKIVDTSDVSIVCIIAAEISSDQEGE